MEHGLFDLANLSVAQVLKKIKTIEFTHDMPHRERLQLLERILASCGNLKVRTRVLSAVRRMRAASKQPKYPIFFDLDPLLKRAFQREPTDSIEDMLDTMVLRLRLTTMMRSTDVAHIASAIFTQDAKFFLR